MLMLLPAGRNMYVASVAFFTSAAQLPCCKSTGMGCFFFLKNVFPARSEQGMESILQDLARCNS